MLGQKKEPKHVKQEGKKQGKGMREKKGGLKIGLCNVFRIGQ